MFRKYTAHVVWPNSDFGREASLEEVDATAKAGETAKEAVERVLRERYDIGWRIIAIRPNGVEE
jgi:hypothetical protein